MSASNALAIEWAEQGYLPDSVIRHGIRRLLAQRLVEIDDGDCEAQSDRLAHFVAQMDAAPLAPLAHKANEQHYEVPARLFEAVLGKHLKYSCCYWKPDTTSLDDAEEAALRLTCDHAEIEDGMRVLELGCGWGSLTLWMAERYPNARVTAISNSASQRLFIQQRAAERGLDNVEVLTRDMNEFATDHRFERIVSVEMFEHMRNYRRLFERLHGWLTPGGRFLMHVFCHRSTPYAFEDNGPSDWMSRHFFSGGLMPSDDLPLHFQDHLRVRRRWRWSGRHYEATANAWLSNMDARREELLQVLSETYGERAAQQWRMRWRMFFMACAELFGYQNGQQWHVSHYLFERPRS